MKTKNTCKTYFKIVGNFKVSDIVKILEIPPQKSWNIGDTRPNGTKYDFASYDICRCEEYDPIVANMMQKTIAPLTDKIGVLNEIREKFDVQFFLVVVPSVYAEDITPCLAPSLAVMDFCTATRTEIDIDLYVLDK